MGALSAIHPGTRLGEQCRLLVVVVFPLPLQFRPEPPGLTGARSGTCGGAGDGRERSNLPLRSEKAAESTTRRRAKAEGWALRCISQDPSQHDAETIRCLNQLP